MVKDQKRKADKSIKNIVDRLYEDTKILREKVLSDYNLSRQIINCQQSMDFWRYIHHIRDSDPGKYEDLKKNIIESENKRLKETIRNTHDEFLKGFIQSKLENDNRDIDLNDDEMKMDAFAYVKSSLPYSKKILGYGHNRIFYDLGKINLADENVWLGYKKRASCWGSIYNPKHSDVAKEIEGLCLNESSYGMIMPRFYLIIYEEEIVLGIVTQDLTKGGKNKPIWETWKNMGFDDGKKYCFDAKSYEKYNYERKFDYGAKLIELSVNINELLR